MARAPDKKYKRASNYRDIYFNSHKRPYRCVYCGRRLKKDKVEVDHLIPVAKAQKRLYARLFLKLKGIHDVNDANNLVAACMHCNRKKSDKMGFWIIKGTLGQYKIYWAIRAIIIITIIFSIIWFIHQVVDLNGICNAVKEVWDLLKTAIQTLDTMLHYDNITM